VDVATDPFSVFLAAVSRATNETQKRELFLILAATGFEAHDFAQNLALGAEYSVRFAQTGLVRRGAVDAFYGSLVIEFENDLARTHDHALDQLRGYVAGAWKEDGSAALPYLAVASDGRHWEVYAPRLVDPAGPFDERDNVELGDPVEAWAPTADTTDPQSLRDLLNRLFFRELQLQPTADNFARDFGLGSPAYLRASGVLCQKLSELAADTALQTKRHAWHDSLQIAYGSIETDDVLLAKHTYLAVLARLLVWAALEHRHLQQHELDDVLDGRYFANWRIDNLVEDDFFRWPELHSATDARRVWLALARHLAGYDLARIPEDILKPLYEALVDPANRKLLGEFYTPDWLATHVTERLLAAWPWESGPPSVIDPACGSGTFLRTSIDHIRAQCAAAGTPAALGDLLSSVVGIDVHPLAVTIARATYLLAIKDLVVPTGRTITIPVFLANTLRDPKDDEQQLTAFATDEITLRIEDEAYSVPRAFVLDGPAYDAAIGEVMAVARSYGALDDRSDVPTSLAARFGQSLAGFPDADRLVVTLKQLAASIADRIHDRRDSVFGFLLKNNYRPTMLRRSFDFVVGNPPWLTVGDIPTGEYKQLVVGLATGSNIAPRDIGEQSHTELATIFLAHAAVGLLRASESTDVRIGLVMPRSLFTATHHRLLRTAAYRPRFKVRELWDLDKVEPLFRVPACALFASIETPSANAVIDGHEYEARFVSKDLPWPEAARSLTIEDCQFKVAYLGDRSAWVRVGAEGQLAGTLGPTTGGNMYEAAFEQGAILYPQTLLIVAGAGAIRRGMGRVAVRTDPRAALSAKLLKEYVLRATVESENLYSTAAAEHILPYALNPALWTVVLPTSADPGDPAFTALSPAALRRAGRVETAAWLEEAEGQWERARKEDEADSLHERLDYLHHLSSQALQKRFIVLFASSSERPFATAIDRTALPLPFVARDKTYWVSFEAWDEADFVTAFLNADWVSDRIKAWQTRGLFGARDVHKRPLSLDFPTFDAANADHTALAATSARLRQAAIAALPRMPDRAVGRQRVWLRAQLPAVDLAEVERLVQRVSEARTSFLLGAQAVEPTQA
jgi:hypothetical protein